MNMHEQATWPLNWHLWMSSRVRLRMTWYQPCNLIPCRSSVQRPFLAVGCRRVITVVFVLQWLSGHTTWLWCTVSLWHILDSDGGFWQASSLKHSQSVLLLLVSGGVHGTSQQARGARWIWPQMTPSSKLELRLYNFKRRLHKQTVAY